MNVQDLVAPCIVRLKVGGEANGTGFFVGRGRILTCHHVVYRRPGERWLIEVFGPGDAWRAEATIEDESDVWDLALLSVDRADDPVVLLGAAANIADPVWTQGYVETSQAIRLEPIVGRLDGERQEILKSGGDPVPLIRFSQGAIVPGMSGAPLANVQTGAVCGIVARTLNRSTDAGGIAVPMRLMLAAFPQIAAWQMAVHKGREPWWTFGLKLPGVHLQLAARIEFVQLFPPGPAVDTAILPPALAKPFRGLTGGMSQEVVEAANYLRARADDDQDPSVLTISPGDPAVLGIRNYWLSVFPQAAARGPRMLAALICEAPPGAFTGHETEILDLLARLRAWPASRGG